jgi:hypothetical protein
MDTQKLSDKNVVADSVLQVMIRPVDWEMRLFDEEMRLFDCEVRPFDEDKRLLVRDMAARVDWEAGQDFVYVFKASLPCACDADESLWAVTRGCFTVTGISPPEPFE